MKKIFAKIHLWLSLPLGIVLTVVCLSGAVLVFEGEITRALHPELYRVAAPADARPLRPSQLADRRCPIRCTWFRCNSPPAATNPAWPLSARRDANN